jgi:hypothetical protein
MKRIQLILVMCGAFVLQSCENAPISPVIGQLPSLRVNISVVDTYGNPVPGIRVSCWNKLRWISGLLPSAPDTLALTIPTSAIFLDMPTKGMVWMALYDMDGRIVLALCSDNTLWGPGQLRATFVTGDYRTPRVLKCRCIVRDASSNILYRDSVYSLCWQPYAERSILGWTSADGSLSSDDSLKFPNVLALPPLVYAAETGWDTLGTFSLSDTLIFALTDTSSHRSSLSRLSFRRGFMPICGLFGGRRSRPGKHTSLNDGHSQLARYVSTRQRKLDRSGDCIRTIPILTTDRGWMSAT